MYFYNFCVASLDAVYIFIYLKLFLYCFDCLLTKQMQCIIDDTDTF